MDRRYKKKMDAYWLREEYGAYKSLNRLDYSTWFDLWHTHPDWNSKGNRCSDSRIAVAKLSYRILKYAEKLAFESKQPIQVFAIISEDTGNNAIYIHTENPNGTPYPHEFKEVLWDLEVPLELRDIVNFETHVIGRIEYTNEVEYVIKKRN